MKVRFKKLSPDAVTPTKAHPTDAGYDISCIDIPEVDADGNLVYHTGLAFEIPEGYAGFLFPRSSVAKQDLILTNCVGVVDSHYRGEVLAKFKPLYYISQHTHTEVYGKGDRIAQMIVMPVPNVDLEEADELSETDRGAGGYGSTGK